MPLALQAKLLRVVETKRFRRLGSTVEHAVDVRFLAATHRDLEEMVRKGQFREDLFYRLSVFTLIFLPPLRERREDIAPLADFFLRIDRRANRQNPFAGRLGAFDRLPLARQRP